MIISDSFTNSLFANICFIISEFPTNIYLKLDKLKGCIFLWERRKKSMQSTRPNSKYLH